MSKAKPHEIQRCSWVKHPLDFSYHDEEWGVPVHNDRTLFEFLVLEGFQAGLSWSTVLVKREHFRTVMDDFDPEKVAKYGASKVESLLNDPGIIRNRLKVQATINNARLFLEVQQTFGSFDQYIWQFTDHQVITRGCQNANEVPDRTPESDAMSKDLKKRGFKFVGTTICYAYMQATGMVNDHITSCFRYSEVARLSR
ncbi:MAG: DNA-3-methyladenine glycosylase I [Salibacteraceae bacterium]